MGAIWANRTRQRQPQQSATVNRSTSLGRRVVSLTLPSMGVDYDAASATRFTKQLTPTVTPTQHGIAAQFGGAVSNNAIGRTDIPYVDEFSWFGRVYLGSSSTNVISAVAAKHGANGVAGDWTLYRNAGGNFIVDWPWVVNVVTTSGTYATDQWVDIALIRSGSAGAWSVSLYVNGVLAGSGSTASNPDTGNLVYQLGTVGYTSGNNYTNNAYAYAALLSGASTVGEVQAVRANPWQLYAPQRTARIYSFPTAGGGATDYPVTASDALTLADSASQTFAAAGVASDALTLADSASNVATLGAAGSDALTLADSVSNVAALSATATDALTLADSASNVAALSATATDALTLADTLNATASGDYTATGSDALTLADSATNVASMGATGSDALTLADAASNTAALGATAADALTLADTLNASATGDYVVVATDALSLSDSVAAAYAAICIATDALSLADATSAAMAGQYAATATDALVLADAVSNAAALGVSISEALTLAVLVSALNPGQLVLGVRGRPGVQIQTGARRAQIQTGTRRN